MCCNVLYYAQLPAVEHCLRTAYSVSVAGLPGAQPDSPTASSPAARWYSAERTRNGSYAGFAFLNAMDSFAPAAAREGCPVLAD